jgi:hypothetical protein
MSSITSIGPNAFKGCTSLITVAMPNTITSIGSSAFESCTSLEEATLSNQITSIPDNVFKDCSALDTITIYKGVTFIDPTAFDNCTLLKTFAASPPYLGTLISDTTEGEYLYDYFLPPGTNGFYLNYAGPICFNEGTKILCLDKTLKEKYIPIEHLQCGSYVKTYLHGYRRIIAIGSNKMINNPNRYSSCMYAIKKSDSNNLNEDLIVTGGHSILVDTLDGKEEQNKIYFQGETYKIDDKYLLVAPLVDGVEKLENNNLYTYYHFVLENDGDENQRYGVWANGMLTETPSFKQFFENDGNFLKPVEEKN